MSLPRIAITLGDVAGIGPEVIARAWGSDLLHACCHPVVVGHPEVIRRAVRLIGRKTEVVALHAPDEVDPRPSRIPCLTVEGDAALEVPPGRVDARAGEAAYRYVVTAAQLAIQREVDAVVTAPLNKQALHAAGHRYPGHTELLAELAGTRDFAMMLYLRRPFDGEHNIGTADRAFAGPSGVADQAEGLGVVHVTLHVPLAKVPSCLGTSNVLAKIRLGDEILRQLHGRAPQVGVAALNPHAGEGGLFGDEEAGILQAAIEQGHREGIEVSGPWPADTLFARAVAGEFDCVVAMYHDQGHIPLKLLGMHRAVNVTVGLPFVRTSVAHGTALDIAWQGRAEAAGMVEAVRVAARLAGVRSAGGAVRSAVPQAP